MQFLRNAWYMAMWGEQLGADTILPRTILKEKLAFYRTADGDPVGLTDACPHRFAPMHMGKVVGDGLRCAYHGLEFGPDGACRRNPNGTGTLPPARLRAYPTVERHSIVWVWMGEPAAADHGLIPDVSILDPDAPNPATSRDWMRMKANYQLIIENLLDLSHVSFLHEGILGNDETKEAPTKLTRAGETVTVRREMPGVSPPKMFDLLFRRDGQPVDMYPSMSWYPPGCLVNDVVVAAPGAPRSEGTGVFGTHFLTPEDERTTLYHFAAVRQNPLPFPAEIADEIRQALSDLRRTAFMDQDAPLIEAQQANLDALGEDHAPPVLFNVDVGGVAYKRILDEMIARETRAG